jgi:3'(2'), 5'-bisphosphate nucleotidase
MSHVLEKEKEAALRAVLEASELCVRVQSVWVDESTLVKKDRSPVTIADYASQAVVCKILQEIFPSDPIVAEEDSHQLREPVNREILQNVVQQVRHVLPDATPANTCSWIDTGCHEPASRFWTLDPIDGTKGFLRGGQYAIAPRRRALASRKGEPSLLPSGERERYKRIHRDVGTRGSLFRRPRSPLKRV